MSLIELNNAKMKVADAEHKALINKGYLLALETFELLHHKKMSDELLSELRESIDRQKQHNNNLNAEWRQCLQELSEVDLNDYIKSD